MANILALHNYSGAKWWRLEQVAKYINMYSGGKHQMVVKAPVFQFPQDAQVLQSTDLIVLQAIGDQRIQTMIENMRAEKGTKIIYELDDLYDETTPETNPSAAKTKLIQPYIENIIKISDAMTVTNPKLQEFYKKLNKNVFVLPNYMDFEGFWNVPERQNETDVIRIGWAGGLSHKDDLQTITGAIARILDKYPNTKFVYCGYGGMHDPDAPETQAIYGEDLFKNIPRERRELVSGVPVEYWPRRLSSMDLDIAIAPLVAEGVRGDWNRCKTPIKWMEYSAMKVPTVCSRVKYEEVVDQGRTGFLAETEDEWVEYISKLVEDAQLRKDIGINAYNDVKANHSMKDHWTEWLSIYEGVLDGKYKYEGPRGTDPAITPTTPDLRELDFGLGNVKDEERKRRISEGLKAIRP